MKKIIGVFCFAILAGVMFINASSATDGMGQNVDLASLLEIESANAECAGGGMMDGDCTASGQHCFFVGYNRGMCDATSPGPRWY